MSDAKTKKKYRDWNEMGRGTKNLSILAALIGLAGCAILFGFVFMWLWNWIVPRIFRLPSISFWEGWGIVALAYLPFLPKLLAADIGEKNRIHKLRRRMKDVEQS
jgi:hypothetical protein